MKELRRWLEWAITETHVPASERANRGCGLSGETDTAWSIIVDSAAHITARALGTDFDTSEADIAWCLTHHPEAFRDLCLSFADAVEKMRERVPEHVETWEQKRNRIDAEPREVMTDEEFNARNDPGRDWWKTDAQLAASLTGIQALKDAIAAVPKATPSAAGSHMHDVLCQCGGWILKPGHRFLSMDNTLHMQGGCAAPQPHLTLGVKSTL